MEAIDSSFLKERKIAHRGLYNDTIPENSLAAFKNAAEHGFAFETDVHFSKDKKLVLFHDNNLKRMTGIDKLVSDCTSEELKDMKLNNTEEKIPFLEDLLNLKLGTPLLLEIKPQSKADTNEFLESIAAALDKYEGKYAIQSFNPYYVSGYKKIRPNAICGLLSKAWFTPDEVGGGWLIGRIKGFILKSMYLTDLNTLDFLSYNFADLPQSKVTYFPRLKLGWTVRSEEEQKQAMKYVDNIIFEKYIPSS